MSELSTCLYWLSLRWVSERPGVWFVLPDVTMLCVTVVHSTSPSSIVWRSQHLQISWAHLFTLLAWRPSTYMHKIVPKVCMKLVLSKTSFPWAWFPPAGSSSLSSCSGGPSIKTDSVAPYSSASNLVSVDWPLGNFCLGNFSMKKKVNFYQPSWQVLAKMSQAIFGCCGMLFEPGRVVLHLIMLQNVTLTV